MEEMRGFLSFLPLSEIRDRSAMPIRVGPNALCHDKRLSNPSTA
jgi:hypothetical protein